MVEGSMKMAKKKKQHDETALIAVQSAGEVTVLPPDSGVVGNFLDNVRNTFKARSMRMNGLMNRINQTGERMEGLLRMAAERVDAAEARLEDDLRNQGLVTAAEEEEE
ncbi:hypothetical protein ACFL2Q_05980 [Thermodesulfobacteriota bacterium]